MPRPGGLLAAMRERGTLPPTGIPQVPLPAPLAAAPAPVAVPAPKAAMVEVAAQVPAPAAAIAQVAPVSVAAPMRTLAPPMGTPPPQLGTPPLSTAVATTGDSTREETTAVVVSPSPGGGPAAGKARTARAAKRPPVPTFTAPSQASKRRPRAPPPPCVILRQVRLPPPNPEDNYELSDKGEDSDAEEPDRSHKFVPEWSNHFLDMIEKQEGIDPDTIFGSTVPTCDLEVIFTDADYAKKIKERPKRRRGSSGEWKQDRLGREEVGEYKRKMGHAKRWPSPCQTAPKKS